MNIKNCICKTLSIFLMSNLISISIIFQKKNHSFFYVTAVVNLKNLLISFVSKVIRLTALKVDFIRSCIKSRLISLLFHYPNNQLINNTITPMINNMIITLNRNIFAPSKTSGSLGSFFLISVANPLV